MKCSNLHDWRASALEWSTRPRGDSIKCWLSSADMTGVSGVTCCVTTCLYTPDCSVHHKHNSDQTRHHRHNA